MWKRSTEFVSSDLLGVHVVEVVLDALDADGQIRLIELVLAVPAEGAVLAPLLQHRVQEGHGVEQHRPRAGHRIVEQVLRHVGEGALEAGAHALRRFVGELDRRLQQADGEVDVHFGGDPQPEVVVHLRVRQSQRRCDASLGSAPPPLSPALCLRHRITKRSTIAGTRMDVPFPLPGRCRAGPGKSRC